MLHYHSQSSMQAQRSMQRTTALSHVLAALTATTTTSIFKIVDYILSSTKLGRIFKRI
jgi:hypothetical protein